MQVVKIVLLGLVMSSQVWSKSSTAVLGGGCFWCLEAVFQQIQGVDSVVSGYAGGDLPNPTYRQVTAGQSGHAEVVKIYFDPQVISYKDLLTVFFYIHDPTTLNRQGNDVGPQYRSIILAQNEEQFNQAKTMKKQVEQSGDWGKSLVTEIVSLEKFYPAEDYHQEYYELNQEQPYCKFVINPKLEKLKSKFLHLVKKQ